MFQSLINILSSVGYIGYNIVHLASFETDVFSDNSFRQIITAFTLISSILLT